MIKIELTNTAQVLKFHYTNLTVKIGKEYIIETHLKARITKYSASPNGVNLVRMYRYLISKIKKNANGFSLLTAKPEELSNFVDRFERVFGTTLDGILRVRSKHNGKDILYRDDLLNAFYYGSYDKWKAYQLAKKIGINVCPYCNRSYTFVLGNEANKGTRFEYDHFFDKVTYPYLALSFFNLIPSCHICNSSFKGFKKFTLASHIHPYLYGFSTDIVFSIKPKTVQFLNGKHSAYRIRFKKGDNSIWDNSMVKSAYKNIYVFGLSKLYNMHKDYVDEIIQKSIIYNSDYIKDLYGKYGGTLFSSEEDVKRMVLGNYVNEEDYSKRPLSKLTADISRELGIIK